MTKQRDHRNSPIDSSTRDRLSAEFRERWVRAGQPTLVHHILGNMSQAHNVPLGILKNIAREVRSARVTAMPRAANAPLPLAVVDGSNLAWARTDAEGRPRLDNLLIVRQALTERGYQAVVVVDAALRHQVSPRDASELERLIQGQDVVQAPAATDGDEWVLRIAEHHAAPVISNDRYDEYSAAYPWVAERRIAAIFVDHSALLQGDALDGAGRPPSSPSELRDEVDQLRQLAADAQSSADDAAALRGRVARLEAHLAREQGRAATLQADVARLEAAVDEERRSSDTLRGQLREFPEQIERLMRALSDTREDAESMREERDQLRARVDDLTRQAEKAQAKQPQGERNAPATHADIDALRRELRDLSRAASEGKSPLPRILAMTREVREAVAEVRSTANRSVEALDQIRRTTALLVDLALYDDDEDDDDDDDDADDDHEGEDESAGTRSKAADGGTAEGSDSGSEDPDEESTTDWRSEFDRVEEAWLAGRTVGDPHEGINFLSVVAELGLAAKEPLDIVARLDRFRSRAGGEPDRFSYCSLHGAIHLVQRNATLDNPLVLVRFREITQRASCTGMDQCPGIGEHLEVRRR